jgi:hypothetical protein
MLEKLRISLGMSAKDRREREINWIGYAEKPSRLVIEFTDGTTRTHLNVLPGHIVGLRVAADKLDYYESQIAPDNLALEIAGARTIANTSTKASIHIRPNVSAGFMSLGATSLAATSMGAPSMGAMSIGRTSKRAVSMATRAAAVSEKRRAQS